jgi:hypothetical protein
MYSNIEPQQFTYHYNNITEFDKQLLRVILQLDDGSQYICVRANPHLEDKFVKFKEEYTSFIDALEQSLKRWCACYITANSKDFKFFTNVISSFYIYTPNKEDPPIITINIAREFSITVPKSIKEFEQENTKEKSFSFNEKF